VDVQVAATGLAEEGERRFRIVGLPDSALREGRDRIVGAVRHGGWPQREIAAGRRVAPPATRRREPVREAPLSMLVPMWLLVIANIWFGLDTELTVGIAETAVQLLGVDGP
jgi:hypothetical protein